MAYTIVIVLMTVLMLSILDTYLFDFILGYNVWNEIVNYTLLLMRLYMDIILLLVAIILYLIDRNITRRRMIYEEHIQKQQAYPETIEYRIDVNIVRALRRLDKVAYILKQHEGVKQMNEVLDGFIDAICERNQTIRIRLEEKVLDRINRFYKLSEERKIILVNELKQLFEKMKNVDMIVEFMRLLILRKNMEEDIEIWSVANPNYKYMRYDRDEYFWSLFNEGENMIRVRRKKENDVTHRM